MLGGCSRGRPHVAASTLALDHGIDPSEYADHLPPAEFAAAIDELVAVSSDLTAYALSLADTDSSPTAVMTALEGIYLLATSAALDRSGFARYHAEALLAWGRLGPSVHLTGVADSHPAQLSAPGDYAATVERIRSAVEAGRAQAESVLSEADPSHPRVLATLHWLYVPLTRADPACAELAPVHAEAREHFRALALMSGLTEVDLFAVIEVRADSPAAYWEKVEEVARSRWTIAAPRDPLVWPAELVGWSADELAVLYQAALDAQPLAAGSWEGGSGRRTQSDDPFLAALGKLEERCADVQFHAHNLDGSRDLREIVTTLATMYPVDVRTELNGSPFRDTYIRLRSAFKTLASYAGLTKVDVHAILDVTGRSPVRRWGDAEALICERQAAPHEQYRLRDPQEHAAAASALPPASSHGSRGHAGRANGTKTAAGVRRCPGRTPPVRYRSGQSSGIPDGTDVPIWGRRKAESRQRLSR